MCNTAAVGVFTICIYANEAALIGGKEEDDFSNLFRSFQIQTPD